MEIKRQGIINAVDNQALGKGTKIHLESRPRNDKTKDEANSNFKEKGKQILKSILK